MQAHYNKGIRIYCQVCNRGWVLDYIKIYRGWAKISLLFIKWHAMHMGLYESLLKAISMLLPKFVPSGGISLKPPSGYLEEFSSMVLLLQTKCCIFICVYVPGSSTVMSSYKSRPV